MQSDDYPEEGFKLTSDETEGLFITPGGDQRTVDQRSADQRDDKVDFNTALLWEIFQGITRLYDVLLVLVKETSNDEHLLEDIREMHRQGATYYPPAVVPDGTQDGTQSAEDSQSE